MFLGVDVGGTKIAVGVVDPAGQVVWREQRSTHRHGTAEEVFAVVAGLVGTALARYDVEAVGVGSAGPVDIPNGTVSPLNIPAWRGFPLRARVAEVVGLPVVLAGDGPCMALGEHWVGAGRGASDMVGLVVSTGVGGGLVHGGRLFGGRTGNAGHIGHVVVEPDGDPCSCGGRGCVEIVASGPNLVRWARARGWSAPGDADAAHLAAAARHGDEIALAAFTRAGRAVGLAIAGTAALCDLELAVVGGGVAQAGDLLFDPIRATVAEYATMDFTRGTVVVPAALGGNAGIVGAAALVARG
ncbi:ROK family protein [Actinokineospora sp. PR83]|uniref:ROK family protein n=1 Tax=Actinokineospora sp. PR83 TaxID=2884908 RepID=UPI0027E162CA|nr:ROK family protein [Actinokineospora sp. PR83]MCG8916680.1 ROK family protein [Actinokineospora sp. PR83]